MMKRPVCQRQLPLRRPEHLSCCSPSQEHVSDTRQHCAPHQVQLLCSSAELPLRCVITTLTLTVFVFLFVVVLYFGSVSTPPVQCHQMIFLRQWCGVIQTSFYVLVNSAC